MAAPERIGRYLVFAPFARGGMASVHLGRLDGDGGFSRVVAIKRPLPSFDVDDDGQRMLSSEARLLARIRHPNVVEVLDVVREESSFLLVMEYVHGVSLGELRRLAEAIPLPVLSAIVIDALRGLHAAHEARGEDGAPLGIVHRDLSPQNVLVGADGIARVLDFGVAKAIRKDERTVSGDLKGTVAYLSPEQVRGDALTRQSDLFMAGAVLFEALTGTKPFTGADLGAVLGAIVSAAAPIPSQVIPALPAALDAVVARALAKTPRQRFQSAQEMAQALAEACPPATPEEVARFVEYAAADQLAERATQLQIVEAHVEPTAGPRVAPPRRRRRGVPLAIAAAVSFAVALVLAINAVDNSPPPAAVAAPPAPEPAPPTAETTVTAIEPVTIADEPVVAPDPPPIAPAAHRSTRSVSKGPRAKAADCDPPFSVDDKGRRHYKAKCLP